MALGAMELGFFCKKHRESPRFHVFSSLERHEQVFEITMRLAFACEITFRQIFALKMTKCNSFNRFVAQIEATVFQPKHYLTHLPRSRNSHAVQRSNDDVTISSKPIKTITFCHFDCCFLPNSIGRGIRESIEAGV